MRPIDAHALYREYQEKVCDGIACHECKATNKDGTCKLDLFISTAPTIDAVQVVRCKHCRRWTNGDDTYGTCQWNQYQTLQTRYDDYCSHGEKP